MLAKTLKKLRENCGYTQQQVADALNIDRSTYTYYETAKTTPDINTIIKLCKIFNVSYSDILEDEGQPQQVKDYGDDELVSKYSRKNTSFIYELSKNEKQLIIYYRLLPSVLQEKLLENITSQLENLQKHNHK